MAYIQKGDNPITRTKSKEKVLPIDDMSSYENDYDQNEDITTARKTKEISYEGQGGKEYENLPKDAINPEGQGGIDYESADYKPKKKK